MALPSKEAALLVAGSTFRGTPYVEKDYWYALWGEDILSAYMCLGTTTALDTRSDLESFLRSGTRTHSCQSNTAQAE